MYLVNLMAKIIFIFINTMTLKYNQEVWCSDSQNYLYAFNNAKASGYFMYKIHWLLSFLNLVTYVLDFGGLFGLLNLYQRKMYILEKETLKAWKKEN